MNKPLEKYNVIGIIEQDDIRMEVIEDEIECSLKEDNIRIEIEDMDLDTVKMTLIFSDFLDADMVVI